jgi:transposase
VSRATRNCIMVHEMNTQTTRTLGAATQGGRRPTGVVAPSVPLIDPGDTHPGPMADPGDTSPAARPDPEVTPKAERRRFTKTYKLDILRQADACTESGQIGALLRREGLFSSNLANWRLQRSQGQLGDSARKKRVPASTTDRRRVQQLEHENARLKVRLQQAELILDIQKKVSTMLGIPLKPLTNEGSDS